MPNLPTLPGERWMTAQEASAIWGKSVRTILLWCHDGTFVASRVRTHYDSTFSSAGKWWICVPPELSHRSQSLP